MSLTERGALSLLGGVFCVCLTLHMGTSPRLLSSDAYFIVGSLDSEFEILPGKAPEKMLRASGSREGYGSNALSPRSVGTDTCCP